MKCPVCKAKLMPVQGDLFCLQCGQVVHNGSVGADGEVQVKETTDPLLRRAVNDAIDAEMDYSVAEEPLPAQLPVTAAVADRKTKHTFAPLWAIMTRRQPAARVADEPVAAPRTPAPAPAPAAVVIPVVEAPMSQPAAPPKVHSGMAWAWMVGVLGLAVFLGLNLGAQVFFEQRVYPGVRIGGVNVGLMTYTELKEKLPAISPGPKLIAKVDGKSYSLDLGKGGMDAEATIDKVRAQARDLPLPIVGLAASWAFPPLEPVAAITDDAVDLATSRLVAQVNRIPTDAVPVTSGKNVVVLAEKPGVVLDPKTAAVAIRAAYGRLDEVNITTKKQIPATPASAYADDVAYAQAITTTNVQINIKSQHYSPTAEQIAAWLIFNGPGKGVQVNPGAVASYVAVIPGKFDKAGTYKSILDGLNAHQQTVIAPSLVASAVPAVPNLAAKLPLVKFTYCVDDPSGSLGGVVRENLTNAAWGLTGQVKFELVSNNCNLAFHLTVPDAMKNYDVACARQNTCRIHNELVISASAWAKPPGSWSGTEATYRQELINHALGQWMGFDHAGCEVSKAPEPVLSEPTVIIPGCSPKWYAVPVETQDTKVLAGFSP